MIPTYIGLIQLLFGTLLLVGGSSRHCVWFLLVSAMFGGSAAIQLPALGGSSIPPVQFALLFVMARLVIPGSGNASQVVTALRENVFLCIFVIYGVFMAFIGPRLFHGSIDVTPLRNEVSQMIYYTEPLRPSSQNITTSVYLIGVAVVAVAMTVLCRLRGGAEALVKSGVVVGWLHALTGMVEVATRGSPVGIVFQSLRNGSYQQLSQSVGGVARMNGLFPEPSAYAAFAFGLFVFMAECWYRSVLPKRTGSAAIVLFIALIASTASTGYLGLAAYAIFFLCRAVVFSRLANAKRVNEAGIAFIIGAIIIAAMLAALPSYVDTASHVLDQMVFSKAETVSGKQRWFWMAQGVDAMLASGGLGIGPGSFRSSSLLTAILGSMGIVGILSIVAYALWVFRPARQSTWGNSTDLQANLSGACGTAALLSVIPALFTAASPVPDFIFGVLAGASLALRPHFRMSPASSRRQVRQDVAPTTF